MRIPASDSTATSLAWASASWVAFDSLRTRRPKKTAESATNGTMPNIISVSLGLVTSSMASAPRAVTRLRSTMLRLAVTAVCSDEASDERRLESSPVFWVSKKPISCFSRAA